jgi:hypothetical protein
LYTQDFEPVSNSLGLSSIFAVLPLLTLFVLLGGVKMKAQWASLIALGFRPIPARRREQLGRRAREDDLAAERRYRGGRRRPRGQVRETGSVRCLVGASCSSCSCA